MNLPKTVTLVEVGPRDGLQNEQRIATPELRVELINRLADSGLQVIEAGSFVSPKWIPQMADTDKVLSKLDLGSELRYPVLVPNEEGVEKAIEAGVREIAVFASATESISRKNTNCSISESLKRLERVCERALAVKIEVRGYISCVLECPIEGVVEPSKVTPVANALIEMGCFQVSLGDTLGTGTPGMVTALIESLTKGIPVTRLAGHFHDTYGQGLANVLASMQLGVTTFDSSVAGLGGCPYAPGASGNLATEDLLYMLDGMGIETGVSIDSIMDTVGFISRQLKRPLSSKVSQALTNKPAGREDQPHPL